MDGAQLSRYPHLSWFGFSTHITPADGTVCWNWRGTVHSLDFIAHGHGQGRSLCRGREKRFIVHPGSVNFRPADGESHTDVGRAVEDVLAYTIVLPQAHLDILAAEDHAPASIEYHGLLLESDMVLQSCMTELFQSAGDLRQKADFGQDETARRLVLRLVRLSGGATPDWHDDASVFDRRTMDNLVEHIDGHLKVASSVSEMGLRVGLSPSHFAKKFRQSTGLSLHRFVNRRRISMAMELLKNQSQPLAHAALEVGFSSQAHFTHVFSDLTGMTPAKYRKQFKRVVG